MITHWYAMRGTRVLFDSIDKQKTLDYANHYYADRGVILEIYETERSPVDHTVKP